jgi:murein L,D-transpeptidase YafK
MNARKTLLDRSPAHAGLVPWLAAAALLAAAGAAHAAPATTVAMTNTIATSTKSMGTPPRGAAPNLGSEPASNPDAATAGLMADRVVVRKSAHTLYLYHGNEIIGAYHVEFGLEPRGPKEREDDFRTPEGHYFLEGRNPHSAYFLSIEVSYPNRRDEARAERHHWEPGGDIMIHGTPNDPRYPGTYYQSQNWTNGCIALSDSNMVDVWMKTRNGIPIDIYP